MNDQRIEEEIVRCFRRHAPPTAHFRMFLFGSRAAGLNTIRSDYDIGIQSEKSLPKDTIVRTQWDLDELDTLNTIEIVNFSEVSEEFKKVALSNTRTLYEQ